MVLSDSDSRLCGFTVFGGYMDGSSAIAQHGYDTLGREYQNSVVATSGQYALVFNRTFVGVTGQQTTTLVSRYLTQTRLNGTAQKERY